MEPPPVSVHWTVHLACHRSGGANAVSITRQRPANDLGLFVQTSSKTLLGHDSRLKLCCFAHFLLHLFFLSSFRRGFFAASSTPAATMAKLAACATTLESHATHLGGPGPPRQPTQRSVLPSLVPRASRFSRTSASSDSIVASLEPETEDVSPQTPRRRVSRNTSIDSDVSGFPVVSASPPLSLVLLRDDPRMAQTNPNK